MSKLGIGILVGALGAGWYFDAHKHAARFIESQSWHDYSQVQKNTRDKVHNAVKPENNKPKPKKSHNDNLKPVGKHTAKNKGTSFVFKIPYNADYSKDGTTMYSEVQYFNENIKDVVFSSGKPEKSPMPTGKDCNLIHAGEYVQVFPNGDCKVTKNSPVVTATIEYHQRTNAK